MGALGLGERLGHGTKRPGVCGAAPGALVTARKDLQPTPPRRAASLATAPHAKPMAASSGPRGQAGELLPSRMTKLSPPAASAPAGRGLANHTGTAVACAAAAAVPHTNNIQVTRTHRSAVNWEPCLPSQIATLPKSILFCPLIGLSCQTVAEASCGERQPGVPVEIWWCCQKWPPRRHCSTPKCVDAAPNLLP